MMNKENVICFPLQIANFPFDLNLPLYLPIAARYASTDEIGPGFDSTSPSITTCFRFKDERSYENSILVGMVLKERKFSIKYNSNLIIDFGSLVVTFCSHFVLHAANSGQA